jgi:hypothetical protein
MAEVRLVARTRSEPLLALLAEIADGKHRSLLKPVPGLPEVTLLVNPPQFTAYCSLPRKYGRTVTPICRCSVREGATGASIEGRIQPALSGLGTPILFLAIATWVWLQGTQGRVVMAITAVVAVVSTLFWLGAYLFRGRDYDDEAEALRSFVQLLANNELQRAP